MTLYTCTDGKSFGGLPGPLAHPCGRAAKALDDDVVVGSAAIVSWAQSHPAGTSAS